MWNSGADLLLLAAMRPPGGGATFITPRLTALMHIVGFTNLDDDNMSRIFNSILEARLQLYDADVSSMGKKSRRRSRSSSRASSPRSSWSGPALTFFLQ